MNFKTSALSTREVARARSFHELKLKPEAFVRRAVEGSKPHQPASTFWTDR
jgi:hypothetical protein